MPKSILDFAKESKLSQRLLYHLRNKGLIGDPLSSDDLLLLRFLEAIWMDREVLRAQLSQLSHARRVKFLETAEYEERWERAVLTRYISRDKGQPLPVAEVQKYVEDFFSFSPSRERILKIKERARYLRKKGKKTFLKTP